MTDSRHNSSIDPKTFAESVRALLSEDVRRYRLFGAYWYFVKALLRKYYDFHNLYFLRGTYEDPSVIERMPTGLDVFELLERAAEEYAENAAFNLGRNEVVDDEGEHFVLLDPDVEG